jgi:phosphatidylglycerophosphate synthase
MSKRIPYLLLYTRLGLGFIILFMSFFSHPVLPPVAVGLLIIGLLTDIFDGIIARKLNISSEKLRRLDSTIDQVFFISVAFASYNINPDFYRQNWLPTSILLASEGLCYLLSFIKFKKEVATHSILAKIWTLSLCSTLITVMLQGNTTIIFWICFTLGIISRVEIILILITLKAWTNDVPSLLHAIKLRKGISIKRNKYFNG